jgi:hypothetical protein
MAFRRHATILARASRPDHGAHGRLHARGRRLLPPTYPPGRAINAPLGRLSSLRLLFFRPVLAPAPGSSPAPTSHGFPPVTPFRHPVGSSPAPASHGLPPVTPFHHPVGTKPGPWPCARLRARCE